jgi:C1A family cysteine protease
MARARLKRRWLSFNDVYTTGKCPTLDRGHGLIMTEEQQKEGVKGSEGLLRAYKINKKAKLKRNYPGSVDWRHHSINGEAPRNYVTPIRDQGECETCVSYTIIAAIETLVLFQLRNTDVDLWEYDLCESYVHREIVQATCKQSAELEKSTNDSVLRTMRPETNCNGISSVAQISETICPTVINADSIKRGSAIDFAVIKEHLAEKGPVLASLSVWPEFKEYAGGVYEQENTSRGIPHCVCIIGYCEGREAWLIKNSWGRQWGENGFGWIAYGNCGIDHNVRSIEIKIN